jgi:hypothetical protein
MHAHGPEMQQVLPNSQALERPEEKQESGIQALSAPRKPNRVLQRLVSRQGPSTSNRDVVEGQWRARWEPPPKAPPGLEEREAPLAGAREQPPEAEPAPAGAADLTTALRQFRRRRARRKKRVLSSPPASCPIALEPSVSQM